MKATYLVDRDAMTYGRDPLGAWVISRHSLSGVSYFAEEYEAGPVRRFWRFGDAPNSGRSYHPDGPLAGVSVHAHWRTGRSQGVGFTLWQCGDRPLVTFLGRQLFDAGGPLCGGDDEALVVPVSPMWVVTGARRDHVVNGLAARGGTG